MGSRRTALAVLLLAGLQPLPPANADSPPEAVFAGPLDATDEVGDRRELSRFAGFIERNAGTTVLLAIQLRAPAAWPTSVFASWARLEWKNGTDDKQEGALVPGARLDGADRLTLAFCRCSGHFEAPYRIDFELGRRSGREAPDLSWADGRLLIRGRFQVVGPSRTDGIHRFTLVPAPPAAAP
jgi:hypothetical protein